MISSIGYTDYKLRPFTDWLNLISAKYLHFKIEYEAKQTIQHEDKKAEYRKMEKEFKRKFSRLHKGFDEFEF
jgi:hypothetical protein